MVYMAPRKIVGKSKVSASGKNVVIARTHMKQGRMDKIDRHEVFRVADSLVTSAITTGALLVKMAAWLESDFRRRASAVIDTGELLRSIRSRVELGTRGSFFGRPRSRARARRVA